MLDKSSWSNDKALDDSRSGLLLRQKCSNWLCPCFNTYFMMYRTPCIEFRAIIFEIIENDPWTFKISKRIAQLDIPIPLLPSSLENTRLSLTEGLKKKQYRHLSPLAAPKDTCLNRRFSWLNPSLNNITFQSETRQRGSGPHSSIRCLTDCSSAFTHFSSDWTWMNCFWIKAQLPTTPP